MDWQRPSLLPVLYRNFFRASVRCGIFQSCLGYRGSPCSDREFHGFIVFNLLATVSVARSLPRYRERAYVPPYALFDTDIFLKATVLSCWSHCRWFQYGRSHISRCRQPTTSTDQILIKMRFLGFLTLSMLLPSFIFFRPRMPPRKGGPIVKWGAFKDLAYLLFSIGMFFAFWDCTFAFSFIGSFAREVIGVNQATSVSLLLIMNGAGMSARILPNIVADRYTGPLNLLIPAMLISSTILFRWISVPQASNLYPFSVFYGVFSASVPSLFPASLTSMTVDLSKIGFRTSMVLTIVSFAALTGSRIAGALLQRSNMNYLYAQCFVLPA